MAEYKLTFGDRVLTYNGWNGYVGYEALRQIYNLQLIQSTGGTITSNAISGYNGDVVTLSNTPNTYYNFNGYSISGATLTGNDFAFDNSDVTAKANFTLKPSAVFYTNNNSYTRASNNTSQLTFNATANSNVYNYFVWKFNAKTSTTRSTYDFRVTFNSNNLSNIWYVGNPKPTTACPLYWKWGATTVPGTTTGCTVKAQSQDVHVYYTGLNTTAARPYKFLYNNSNKTMTIYYNNVAYVTLTGLGTFTAFNSMTFGGNTSYTANGTFSNFSLVGFKDLTAAQSY